MPRRFAPALFAAALVTILFGGIAARAQGTTDLPTTPDPSECTVQPLTAAELVGLLSATPETGMTGSTSGPIEEPPIATPSTFTLPEGTPADNATIAAVTETMRQALACLNGGNYLAFYATISPRLLLEQLGGQGITEDEVNAVGTPEALTVGHRSTLVDVREVVALPDGRVGALVDTIFPDEKPDVQTDFFYFVQQDGRWLIDEIVEDLEGQYPPVATPAA